MKLLLYYGNGIFIDSFGGAEHVACDMANEFVRRGWNVTIVCNDLKSGLPAYPLDAPVRLVNLNVTGRRLGAIPQRLKIAREITRPFKKWGLTYFFDQCQKIRLKNITDRLEIILSEEQPDIILPFFVEDLLALCRCPAANRIPIVQMLHDPPEITIGQGGAIRRALNRTACVQVLLESFVPGVKKHCDAQTVVIPNAVPHYAEKVEHKEKDSYRIVNIARLDWKQKRQHLLIKAFALLADDFPNWTLHFYGGGDDKSYQDGLKKLIANHRLSDRIFLEGVTDRVKEAMLSADIFAFPSKHEGFGIALVEAMGIGLPAVGFKSTPAVNELIRNGENGILTDDGAAAFAEGLRKLMSDSALRARMGENGHIFARQFEAQPIWDRWEALFHDILDQAKSP